MCVSVRFCFVQTSSPSCRVAPVFNIVSHIDERKKETMPEGITAENLLNNIVESLSDGGPKHKSASFFQEEGASSVSAQFNRLFGRQKPIHHCLGGGKSADVLLWRNKKISAGVLVSATAIWVLFEWLNYNFLSLLCFALSIGMVAQFLWKNASGVINRSHSKVPRLVLPNDLFINIATAIGAEINHGLGFLQDVACGGDLKQFLLVVVSLWAAGIIGSWCNFLTVLYIGKRSLIFNDNNFNPHVVLFMPLSIKQEFFFIFHRYKAV
nr:reticulon-like protein B8 isoform X2 [Nicotiana tomentosiformis]